ncbi:M48 family metallopeptidase [Catelliglobosispora koreensis]|uniref:M48 family metallopeptidase n=1 Tax=Catelliglobosispora koreensis TaxID=129052 RepID=UPI0003754B61|nr:M48 family metallopeptidase [Catelliglobosispora koreensis]
MSSNFFDRQRHLRRMSFRLVLLFALAVIGIIITVDLAVLFAFNAFGASTSDIVQIVTVSSIATAAAIGLATLYRTATLRGGGGRVARELGGDYVPEDTTDPQLRRLRNVVEEIAIASGTPVPEVYVLQHEESINAFAAGWSTSDAAVAVTRGALERLNRDELQGVIAHEFSHVVNGDMRLNIRLMGLLFGILFLTVAGETMMRAGVFTRSRDEKSGGNPLPLIGIALVIAGFVGVFFGRMIKASVSRKREYLADASAVQFTRQTTGIAGALKKIAGLPGGSTIKAPKSEEVGHMLFGSGAKKRQSLFATHPPLPDRIKALEPDFDVAQLAALQQHWAQSPPVGMQEDVTLGLTESRLAAGTGPLQDSPGKPSALGAAKLPSHWNDSTPLGLRPATPGAGTMGLTDKVATPEDQHYARAAMLLDRIPPDIRDRAHRVDQVIPLVLGLLLSQDAPVRQAQYAELSARYGPEVADTAFRESGQLVMLDPLLRLPLAEIAFPALRHRSEAEQEAVLDAVQALINADGRISTFEYCFSAMLHSDLYQSMHPKPHWHSERRSLRSAKTEAITLLMVLAEDDPAFRAGMTVAFPDETQGWQKLPVTRLDDVWHVLRELGPDGKEQLINAAEAVVSFDGAPSVREIELLRTVCALLHCPLPPLVIS